MMFEFFLGAPVENLVRILFIIGYTYWSYYGYESSIGTKEDSAWLFGHLYMKGWYCYECTNLRVLAG